MVDTLVAVLNSFLVLCKNLKMVKTEVPVIGFGRSWADLVRNFQPNPMVLARFPESLIFQGLLKVPKPTKKPQNIREPHPVEGFPAPSRKPDGPSPRAPQLEGPAKAQVGPS